MMYVLHFLAVGLVLFFQYLVPGLLVVNRLTINLAAWEKALLSLALSICVQTAGMFLLGHLFGVGVYWAGYGFFLLGLWHWRVGWGTMKESMASVWRQKKLGVFGAVAAISLALTLSLTWITTNQGLVLQAGQLHDSVWHLALTKKLLVSIPPQHPSTYVAQVTNYHYFYDLFLASLVSNYAFDLFITYFQVLPFVMSGLLAGSCFFLSKRLFKNTFGGFLLILFVFFGGSAAYVLPLFLKDIAWHDSSFWVSQTFSMMGNPQVVFSFSLVLLVLVLLFFDRTHKGRVAQRFWLHALILGMAIPSLGFKSYSFVIITFLYALHLFFILVSQRRVIENAMFGVAYLIFALPFALLLINLQSHSFMYVPLWYLTSMVESPDRVYYPIWRLLEDHYAAAGNWVRVAEIKIKELLIFYGGNLGTRSLFLIAPFLTYKQRPKIMPELLLIFSGFLFSSIFPLLFLQKGVVWNSIQFWYYALIFAGILAAWCGGVLWRRTRWPALKALFVILLVAATIPTTVKMAQLKYTKSETISKPRLELVASVPAESRVMICPANDALFDSGLVSLLSGAEIFLANPVQLELMDIVPPVTEPELTEFLSGNNTDALQEIIKAHHITHFLCSNNGWRGMIDLLGSELLVVADEWYLKPLQL